MMELSLTEKLAHSTVRIECLTNSGTSCGTGFIYQFNLKEDNSHVPAIVTNKHVVKGAQRGKIAFTIANEDGSPDIGNYKFVEYDNFESQWIMHDNSEIDLCILFIGPLVNNALKENIKLFYIPLAPSLIPTQSELEDMILMDDIIMVGYPNGIWDSVNNMPIFRRGITATHPNLDWNGKKEFLIDAACFPGSSGSPVFLYNNGSITTKSKGMTIGPSRIRLLGILYAGPQHKVGGELQVIDVPTAQKPIAISSIPNNLGFVIKSSELHHFEEKVAKK